MSPATHHPSVQDLSEDLELWVHTLVGFGDRSTRNPKAYAASASWLKKAFVAFGYQVHRQEFFAGGCACTNIMASSPGFDPSRPHWLIGAHYDNALGTPGADDNISAVAILLAMARELAASPEAKQIRWVAFANEEPPFFHTPEMGSAVCARACREAGDNLRGMICLESLGVFSDEPGSQNLPSDMVDAVVFGQPTDRANFVALVSDEASRGIMESMRKVFEAPEALPVVGAVMPDLGVSDHWPFWKESFPALLVTNTAMFRNRHYHGRGDTPEKLNYPAMARLHRSLVQWVHAIAKP